MAPKSKKNAPVVEEATEEPFEVPGDMPSECPFEVQWTPGIVLVQVERPLDEMAIKRGLLGQQACKCMHVLLEIANAESSSSSPELSSKIQQARAEVGPDGPLPAGVLQQLFHTRWQCDKTTDWQREWIRRQHCVTQSVDAVKEATDAVDTACKRLKDAEEALTKEMQLQEECGVELPSAAEGLTTDGPLKSFFMAQHRCSQDLHNAKQHQLQCEEKVVDAKRSCKAKWRKQQMYWTKGLPCSAADIRGLHVAGLPIVAAILLKSSADTGDVDAASGPDSRPYEAVVREQQDADWDDKILQVASVVVLTGPNGGCFSQREPNQEEASAGAVEGVCEMSAALQRLEEAALAYTDWESDSLLMQLPELPMRLSIYHSLMATVPMEQQSVATIMHCLLEEVACAVESADCDELHDAREVQQASQLVCGALQQRAAPTLLKASPKVDVAHYATVVDGDEPRMRSHGLVSGLVRCPELGKVFACESSENWLVPDGTVHVDGVEDHTAALLWEQWRKAVQAMHLPTGQATHRCLLKALANQAGVDWTMMTRFTLLKLAASMLPGATAEEHTDDILVRHHAIEYSPRAMATRICHCLQQFSAHTWAIDAASSALVLVCHPALSASTQGPKLPCFVPFARYMAAYIKSAPVFCLPELERVVYPISEAVIEAHMAPSRRYLADASWMDVSDQGRLRLVHDASVLVANISTDTHVVLSGANDLHALVQLHACASVEEQQIDTAAEAGVPPQSQPGDAPVAAESEAMVEPDTEAGLDGTASGAGSARARPAMSATIPLPTGISLACHSSGIYLFSGGASVDGAPQELRAVYSDGSVAVRQEGGLWVVRYPDGSTCEQPTAEQQEPGGPLERVLWLSTTTEGQRMGLRNVQPEPPTAAGEAEAVDDNAGREAAAPADAQNGSQGSPDAQDIAALEVYKLGRAARTVKVDPDMGAAITTRIDHTMCIKYPTGDTLVLWPDGSRTTVWSNGTWTVEAEDMPCVRGTPDGMTCQVTAGTHLAWTADTGAMVIEQDGGALLVAADGLVCASLVPERNFPASQLAATAQQVNRGSLSIKRAAEALPPVTFVDLRSHQWAVQSGAVEEQQTVDFFDGEHVILGGSGMPPTQAVPGDDLEDKSEPMEEQPAEGAAEDVGSPEGLEESAPLHSLQTKGLVVEQQSSRSVLPRIFAVSCSTGGGMEIIPPHEYGAYVRSHQGKQGVTDRVEETSSPHVKLHRFVMEHAAVGSTLATLPVSEGAMVAPAEPSLALASLKVPCKSYVAPTAGLVLPRLAAASDPQADPQPQASVLVVKEFLVHDAPTQEDLEQLQSLHAACDSRVAELTSDAADEGSAEEQSVDAVDQEPLLQRLRALEHDAAQRATKVEQEQQRAAHAAAGSRIMMEQEALEVVAGAAAAEMKEYRAWQKEPGEFDHCPQLPQPGDILRYFASEEGLKAQQEDPLLSSGKQGVLRALPLKRTAPSVAEAYAEKGLFGLSCGVDNGPEAGLGEDSIGTGEQPVSKEPADAQRGAAVGAGQEREQGQLLRTYPSDHSGPGGVKLPSIRSKPQRATTMLNDAYLQREYQAMHSVKTASAALIRARGLDDVEFKLGCQMINFGEVAQGTVVQRKLVLHNVSLERARFSVDQVAPPLKLSYQRAPVPAGLRTPISVELHAVDVGAFEGAVVVRSAVNVLQCTVRANVVQVVEGAEPTA